MRHFPLSDEGFKTELPSWIAFHITSVFTALIQCPLMFLDLCIPSCVVSVNTLLDSANPCFLLLSCELHVLSFCFSRVSLSVVYLLFPRREESW